MLTKTIYIYPNLIGMMAANGDTISSWAIEMKMGYQALSARLRGKKSFELPEIYYLLHKYQKNLEYLFSTKSDQKAG